MLSDTSFNIAREIVSEHPQRALLPFGKIEFPGDCSDVFARWRNWKRNTHRQHLPLAFPWPSAGRREQRPLPHACLLVGVARWDEVRPLPPPGRMRRLLKHRAAETQLRGRYEWVRQPE